MSATKHLRKQLKTMSKPEIYDVIDWLDNRLATERNMMIRSSLLQQKQDCKSELAKRFPVAVPT